MNIYIELFTSFFKIGLLTFGGGAAMLPMITKEIVENKKWCTNDEVVDYYAVGQCTPGIIAVNTATFVGYKQKGILGGIVATLGIVAPSFVIINIIALFLEQISDLEIVKLIFAGINIAVCALITGAVVKLGKTTVKDVFGIAVLIIVGVAAIFFNVSPIICVFAAAVSGIAYKKVKGEL